MKPITAAGTFRLGDRLYFPSNALRHYPVGLEETHDGLWSLYFCHVLLARINERAGTLTRGKVLPMFPEYSVTYVPGCSATFNRRQEGLPDTLGTQSRASFPVRGVEGTS